MPERFTLADVFTADSSSLPEGFRTLVVTPERFVEPGMVVRARVSFANVGGAPARGVRVRFARPSGVTYVAGSMRIDECAPANDAADPTGSDGIDIGEVAPGAVRRVSIEYAVDRIAENGASIELQVALASGDMPVTGSNVVALTVGSRPELISGSALAIASDGPVVPGGEVVVTAVVRNGGQSTAHDVVVVLPMPADTEFIAGSAQVDGRPFATTDSREPFGPSDAPVVAAGLAPGASVIISYRARIACPLEDRTQITASGSAASLDAREFELAPASLTVTSPVKLDSDETRLDVLAADGSAAETVTPGQRLTLRLCVRNIGQCVAHALSGSVVLPPSLVYAFGSLKLDGQPYPDPSCSPIACAFGELAPDASAVMTLDATVASPLGDGRILKVDAHVRSLHGEVRRFERPLTVASRPRFDSARNALLAGGPRRIAPGAELVYALTILNTGTVAASDAVLTVTHDPGLEDVVVSEAGERCASVNGSVSLGALAPQMARDLVLRARAASPQTDGTELCLRARVTASEGVDVDLGEQRHLVRSRPRFAGTSSRLVRTSDSALRYDRLTDVAIELSNEGDDAARDVIVALRLPRELELEEIDALPRDGAAISFGDLAAGATRRATVRLRLRARMSRGATITFDGCVHARGSAPFPLDPVALSIDAQPACADATFVSEPRETVAPGSQLAYTLALRNSGDGSAGHIALRVAASDATRFLPGSMSINDAALHDAIALSLFSSQGGLALRDVAPGVEMIVRWLTIVADPLPAGTVLEARATISLDGTPLPAVSSGPITVGAVPAFASAALALPFSVAAITEPQDADPALPVDMPALVPAPSATSEAGTSGAAARGKRNSSTSAVRRAPLAARPQEQVVTRPPQQAAPEGAAPAEAFGNGDVRLTLTAEWLVRALRFSRDVGNSPGFLRHLFAIRLFFPDGAVTGSRVLQAAFNAQRAALRSNQERLILRLRQPHITIEAADLEQADSRAVCTALFSALREPPEAGTLAPAPPALGSLSLTGNVQRQTAATLAERLRAAAPGSASPWLALAHLVGTSVSHGDDNGSAASYRAALVSALTSFEAMEPLRFQRALVTHSDGALDEMLDRFLRSTALAGPSRVPDFALSR